MAPLPTEKKHSNCEKFCAIGHRFQIFSWRHCQQLYEVNKRPQTELCAPLAIRIRIAKSCTRWRGLSQDEGRADFSKNLVASLFNEGLSN
jgi:hypothetical protein